MAVVSMKQFIEAGVHYGHQTRRWNPKMKPYIFGTRHGIHIIDLQKSLRKLKDAYEFVRDLSAKGEPVLFVGTKQQARDIIKDEAVRSGSFYINERWLGGLLTNFNTVKQSIAQLKKMEEQRGEHGLYEGIIKKEAMKMEKKRVKLDRALGGIKEMRKLPGAMYVIDCKKERIAVQEAQKLGVPIVAVVDTNCDPDLIDHVIPGNDDAIRAIQLFTATIANAVMEGRALYDAQARSVDEERPKAARGRGSRAGRGRQEAPAGEAGEGADKPEAKPDSRAAKPAAKAAAKPADKPATQPAEGAAAPTAPPEAAPAQPAAEAAPAPAQPAAEAAPAPAQPAAEAAPAPAQPAAEAAPAAEKPEPTPTN
jgi:small subunit ribosomal protein S2